MNTQTADLMTDIDLHLLAATSTPEYNDAQALEYVMAAGCCTTCLVEGEDPTLDEAELAHLEACPTCGVRSKEWAQAAQIDAAVTALAGLAALDTAVFGA